MKLETPYNKESINKIGKSFWQKDLMTVIKKSLKGVVTSQLFIALCNSNTVLQQSLILSVSTEFLN